MPMRDLYWSRSLWPSTLQHISLVYLPFVGSPWPSRARRQTGGERSQGNFQSASGAPRNGWGGQEGGRQRLTFGGLGLPRVGGPCFPISLKLHGLV